MSKFTYDQTQQIIKEYQSGKSTTNIGNRYSVSFNTIRRLLIKHEIPLRRKWASSNVLCGFCHEIKPRSEFYRDKDYICKKCQYQYKKSLGWITYENKKLGLSRETVRLIKSIQNDVCAICGEAPSVRSLSIDHDHKTGKIRGALCVRCNSAIGLLQDRIDLLDKAINYLQYPPFQKYISQF